MEVFNKGDTAYLLLNYTLNGQPLEQGAYQEIELQINKQDAHKSIKKLFSKNEIVWEENMQYKDTDGTTKNFTGYVCELSQKETFSLPETIDVQLRIMLNNEIGSSTISSLEIGKVLSHKTLTT